MRCELLQEHLVKQLKTLRLAVATKSQLQVLNGFLCQVEKNTLQIVATDLSIGIRTEIAAEVQSPGKFVVPAKLLYEVVQQLEPGKLELELQQNTLLLRSQSGVTKLQTLAPDDFPPFPDKGQQKFSFTKAMIQDVQEKVLFAASKDETRPALTSVLFALGESSRVVATDGFRLSLLELSETYNSATFMIPAKSLQEVCRLFLESQQSMLDLYISEELQQVFFLIAGFEICIRLITEEFPPYEKIIPETFAAEVILDTQILAEQVKRAAIFAREASNIISFIFTETELQITASSSAIGTYSGSMPIKNQTAMEMSIAFNVQYILEYLQHTSAEALYFSMNDTLQPAQFTEKKNSLFRYIVMPFRLNTAD